MDIPTSGMTVNNIFEAVEVAPNLSVLDFFRSRPHTIPSPQNRSTPKR